jgi:hypothetical protein
MSKGRPPARLTKIEKHDKMVKQLEQLSMAMRLNQMMIQQLGKNNESLRNELSNATSMLNDFQYRLLAVQQLNNLDPKKLQDVADALKIDDFNKECVRKDLNDKAEIVNTIESSEDIVILTSSTPGAEFDQGILRSRIKVSETNLPELIDLLVGKSVGDKVTATLNGVSHSIEILGVRRLPKVEEPVAPN